MKLTGIDTELLSRANTHNKLLIIPELSDPIIQLYLLLLHLLLLYDSVFKDFDVEFDSVERTVFMGLQPFVDAVHVEVVPTLAFNGRTVLARILALGTRHFVRIHANHTVRVTNVPIPGGHRKPIVYSHFHFHF